MTPSHEIQSASRRFYAALTRMARGDASAMPEVWSRGPGVSTMHPIGGRELGWDQVKEPWSKVAAISSDGEIALDQQVIEVVGDAAYESGEERGFLVLAGEKVRIEGRVTNIYRREGGAWKMVHHHADVSPAMLDVLGRIAP